METGEPSLPSVPAGTGGRNKQLISLSEYYWAESLLQRKRFSLFLHISPQRGLSVCRLSVRHIRATA